MMDADSPEAAEYLRLMKRNSTLEHALTIAEAYVRTAMSAAMTIAPSDPIVKRARDDLETIHSALRSNG